MTSRSFGFNVSRTPLGLPLEIERDGRLRRVDGLPVFDEVPKLALLAVSDRRIERYDSLGNPAGLANDRERQVGALGQLPVRRLAPQISRQGLRRAVQLVQRLDHVDRDPDRSGLVGDGPGDRLADPPRGVRGELEAPTIVELIDRPHQPDVPLLDEVQERQPAVRVLLDHRYDQPKIGFGQLFPRLVSLHRGSHDRFLDPTELTGGFTHLPLALLERAARLAELLDLAPAAAGPSATRSCLLEQPLHSPLPAVECGSRGIDLLDEALSDI